MAEPLTQAELAAIAEQFDNEELGSVGDGTTQLFARLLATIRERDADIARLLAAIDAANVVGEATNEVLRKLERLIRERGGEG